MSNNQFKQLMEFDLADAPLLHRTLQRGSTVSWMMGSDGSRDVLKDYMKALEEFIPSAAKLFKEETWCEMIRATYKAKHVGVRMRTRSRWNWERPKHEDFHVFVDDQTFPVKSVNEVYENPQLVQQLVMLLRDAMGMEAEFVDQIEEQPDEKL